MNIKGPGENAYWILYLITVFSMRLALPGGDLGTGVIMMLIFFGFLVLGGINHIIIRFGTNKITGERSSFASIFSLISMILLLFIFAMLLWQWLVYEQKFIQF